MRILILIALLAPWSLLAQSLFSPAFVAGLNKPTVSAGTAPDNTLLAHYKANAGSGTNLTDETGSYNGTLEGGATWATGASGSGYALQFDGSDDYARSTGNVTAGTNLVTVSFWLWVDSYANDNDCAVSLRGDTGGANTFWILPCSGAPSSGKFSLQLQTADGYRIESITRPSAAAWHHYVITCDRTISGSDWRIWVDGTEVSTTIDLDTGGSSTNNFAVQPLFFGTYSTTIYRLPSRMDDFRLYQGILTEDEIDYLYANPQ